MEWNAKQLKNSKENETWNFVWYFCTLTYLQNKFFSLAHTSNLHPFIPSLVSFSVCTSILHRVCVIMKIYVCVCVCVCVWYIIPFYQLAIKNVLILLHVNVSSSRTKLLFLGGWCHLIQEVRTNKNVNYIQWFWNMLLCDWFKVYICMEFANSA